MSALFATSYIIREILLLFKFVFVIGDYNLMVYDLITIPLRAKVTLNINRNSQLVSQ